MDATYAKDYEQYERHHWWHVARRELIQSMLDRHVPASSRWLDVGCGSGVALSLYQRIADKLGVEADPMLVERARRNNVNVVRTEAHWDFSALGRFDLITLCDVIEHVEDDQSAIAAVHRALRDGGTCLVTVPALRSLWSAHDVRNQHFRRYVDSELRALFAASQWEILRLTYFCGFLLPGVWTVRNLQRLLRGTDPKKVPDDMRLGHPWLDRMLLKIFRAECRLVQRSDLPAGSSLLLVARKRPAAATPLAEEPQP